MTEPTRARIIDAALHEIEAAGPGKVYERRLDVARGIADRLGRRRDTPTEPPPATDTRPTLDPSHPLGLVIDSPARPELDLGCWIDDPPRIALDGRYLDRLLELPLGHVAVMLDGPEPGLSDARWDWRDLERLRRRLPDRVETVLTVWIAPHHRAIDELGSELPHLLDALGSRTIEGDHEPAGHWRESGVLGYEDEDGDGRRLDDAIDALADAICDLPIDVYETTTFPGALRLVAPLLEELARSHREHGMDRPGLRYYGQHYGVRHRGGREIPWDHRLGPDRLPREAHAAAVRRLPAEVEVCAGLAAYDTRWPDGRDGIPVSLMAAREAGARRIRKWSSKWLARKRGHKGRRRLILEALSDLDGARV